MSGEDREGKGGKGKQGNVMRITKAKTKTTLRQTRPICTYMYSYIWLNTHRYIHTHTQTNAHTQRGGAAQSADRIPADKAAVRGC